VTPNSRQPVAVTSNVRRDENQPETGRV
jgi:hypothetical protein